MLHRILASRLTLLALAVTLLPTLCLAQAQPHGARGSPGTWKTPHVTDFVLEEDVGVVSLGYELVGAKGTGGIEVYVDAPDGTPVVFWALDDDGLPTSVLAYTIVDSYVAHMPLGGGDGGILPPLAFQLDTPAPDGTADVIGRGTIEWHALGDSSDPAGDADGGWGLPSASISGVGVAGDGGGDGGFSFLCNKSECELKIVLANGVEITDTLKKDSTVYVSARHAVYAVCACD